MEAKSRINVSQAFHDNFKAVQERWLQADDYFKSGRLFYGLVAANQIKNMYYLLPASRVIADDMEKKGTRHQTFIDELDSFRLEIYRYAKTHGAQKDLTPEMQFGLVEDFLQLDSQYDSLVKKFYLQMFEFGFSP